MKKTWLTILICGSLVLFFAGCQNSTSTADKNRYTSSAVTSACTTSSEAASVASASITTSIKKASSREPSSKKANTSQSSKAKTIIKKKKSTSGQSVSSKSIIDLGDKIIDEDGDEKERYKPGPDDIFAADKIIVIIKNKYSMDNKQFTPLDFPEADIISVYNLSTISSLDKGNPNYNDFCQIITLTLRHPGKQNILDAIHKVEESKYVKEIFPNYYVQCD